MVLSIPLSDSTERLLRQKADDAGVDVATYAAGQLEAIATARPTFDEIAAPIARAFAESGMTEEELVLFLDEEIHAMRREKRSQKLS